jgi:CBS domain-containing protein
MALALLERTTIGEVITTKPNLISVFSDTPISECLRILHEKNILAVPVFSKPEGSCIGIVDVFDIMRFTALGFFEDRIYNDELFEEFNFAGETAGDLIAKSAHSQDVFSLNYHESMLDALKLMSDHQIHRLLVRFSTHSPSHSRRDSLGSPNSSLTTSMISNSSSGSHYVFRLFTQTDAITYLYEKVPQIFNVELSKFQLSQAAERVVSICPHETALDGFLKMFDNGVNAVAVIEDDSYKIVANLSAADLLGITLDKLKFIKLPVLEYLKKRNELAVTRPVVCCTLDETLKNAIHKTLAAKVHRVWLVDEAQTLIGVLTFTDILRCFFALSTPA